MRAPALLVVALAATAAPTSAQDVEMLGARYGTRPPAAYYETLRTGENAFEFSRGRTARLRARMAAEANLDPGVPRVIGPRDGPVQGTFRVPVLLGLFSDSPEADAVPYGKDDVQTKYFGVGPGTITDFYSEISGNRVTLNGDVVDWTRASFTKAQATEGNSGLSAGTTGEFILQILARLNDVDWGPYDNDGPDGQPNSGDDDGFVDAVAVIHPTSGGECGGIDGDDRIWSHRWSLRFAAGQTFTTTTPSAGGGFIQVDDYTVQPLLACGGGVQSEIGVFAHEFGHAFGLPDLYDTRESFDGKHGGAGNWDLMASGAWGCDGSSPESPCHMGAWSKATLGWVDVVTAPANADLGTITLAPVETSGTVYRVDAGDDSGEYFLLENRQRIGYDQNLYGEGLLIWQIDPDWVATHWRGNNVNAFSHMGVWLRQADGRNDLGTPGHGRGDANDPFPWIGDTDENRAFHAASRPAATSDNGTATGLTLLDIATAGQNVTFRMLTRFTTISMRAEGGLEAEGVFTVDGSPVSGALHSFTSAPFVEHRLEASAGNEIEPGVRKPFRGWDDDATALRARVVETPLADTEFVARYDGRQVQLAIESSGGINGVEPGTFTTQPASSDLWFDEGTPITVEAVPTTGFAFGAWTGSLAGQPNPASVTMNGPVQAGASWDLIYALPSTPVAFPAGTEQTLQLEAEHGTAPVVWRRMSGALPHGISLDPFGTLRGTALEMGSFPLVLRATDARGLQVEGEVVLEVDDPGLTVDQLTSFFFGVGPAMEAGHLALLDHQGNQNGGYDLGDFRAWVLANPGLPHTARLRALMGPRSVVIPMRPVREEGRR